MIVLMCYSPNFVQSCTYMKLRNTFRDSVYTPYFANVLGPPNVHFYIVYHYCIAISMVLATLYAWPTSCRKVSWSVEAVIFDVLWLYRFDICQVSRQMSEWLKKVSNPISRLRDFTRSCGRTSGRLVTKDPDTLVASSNNFLFTIFGNCLITLDLLTWSFIYAFGMFTK